MSLPHCTSSTVAGDDGIRVSARLSTVRLGTIYSSPWESDELDDTLAKSRPGCDGKVVLQSLFDEGGDEEEENGGATLLLDLAPSICSCDWKRLAIVIGEQDASSAELCVALRPFVEALATAPASAEHQAPSWR